jgi:hypothetical protein
VAEFNSRSTLRQECKRFAEGRRQERVKVCHTFEAHKDAQLTIFEVKQTKEWLMTRKYDGKLDLGDFKQLRTALDNGEVSSQTLVEQAQLACLLDEHNAVCEVLALSSDLAAGDDGSDGLSVKGMPFSIKECVQYQGMLSMRLRVAMSWRLSTSVSSRLPQHHWGCSTHNRNYARDGSNRPGTSLDKTVSLRQ